tara:strand:+ start:199 stop:564 length:366 start_codon:yes stop_codon:yes gene_type:complete
MLDTKNLKEILSLLKDKTVQTALAALAVAIFSFMGGRVTAPSCEKSVICLDISNDRDELTRQLSKQRQECAEEKTDALKKLRNNLNVECALDVERALEGSSFDPEIHCPICIARGECSQND